MNSFIGIASAPNLAAPFEMPAPDAARIMRPSAARIHKLAITTAPPRRHPIADLGEANKARIAALIATSTTLVRWIDEIVGTDHDDTDSGFTVLALETAELGNPAIEAAEQSEQE